MDENEFFRRATLRICGSLDMDAAMQKSLEYISEAIPADHLILGLLDKGLGAMRPVSVVALNSHPEMHSFISLSPQARKMIEDPGSLNLLLVDRPDQDSATVRIINDPEADPVTGPLLGSAGSIDSSLLVMRLETGGVKVGSLILRVTGKGRYTEEHGRLLTLLREPFAIALSNALKHKEILELKDILADDNKYLHRELFHASGDHIIGAEGGLKGVMDLVEQVAPLDSHVLLRGETGVGKDVIAHLIHDSSPRKDGPFIKVNCGAIVDTLIDSELFGHEKGAFTGATSQKRGYFELADHGTIFLDEIGELPLAAQVRLLLVLQYREIQRVGGSAPVPTDIRIIAATHRGLEDMVETGQFRQDLWFRLNIFPIVIPPLRMRKKDIPVFVDQFIQRRSRALRLPATPTLAPRAIDQLTAYDWPGNVRELENVLERALILSRGNPLTFDGLLGSQVAPSNAPSALEADLSVSLEEVVSNHIKLVLQKTGGRIHGPRGAAELLRINPSTLRSKMNKLGIPYGRHADQADRRDRAENV
jgi:formate hydrogenlyase transcriptional activator